MSMSTAQQSDARSVSSGLSSNNSSNVVLPPALQQTTSSSVASSQQQVPIVQNPFETLSSVSSVTNTTTNLPPSHVAIRMPQAPPPSATMIMMQSQSQLQSPMKINMMSTPSNNMPISTPPPPKTTTSATTGIPIMGTNSSNISIPIVPPHQQVFTTTNLIPSPMSNTSYLSNDFPMYDHPPSAQNPMTNLVGTTNYATANDFIFDDDENTVPSSLGNTTDDQLSQQHQQQQYRNRPHSQQYSSNNRQDFDHTATFPTMIGSSSLTSRIIESTKRFITSGSSNELNPDNPPTHRSTTTTPVLTATSVLHNSNSDPNHNAPACLISGYLQKLGRNQKWQTRWFETNGMYLSYYKSSKRSNLLATLDLQKVCVRKFVVKTVYIELDGSDQVLTFLLFHFFSILYDDV